MPERRHQITAVTGNDLFRRAYVDRLFFGTNMFQGDVNNGNPIGSYVTWDVGVDNNASTSADCQPGLISDQSVFLRYKMQSTILNRVKGFPAIVCGTLAGTGRAESSGLGCNGFPVAELSPVSSHARRSNFPPGWSEYLTSNRNTPVYEMKSVQDLCGFPQFVGQLEDVTIEYDIVASGTGNHNQFLDMYLCDVSDRRRIPGGYPGLGYGTVLDGELIDTTATTSVQPFHNTINGLNYNLTKDWNINVWLDIPTIPNDGGEGESDGNWAGGRLVGEYSIGGVLHDFYYKIETGGSNNFDYIGLVMKEPQLAGTIRVLDYINFARNQLPQIIATNTVANQMYHGTSANPRTKPPPRFPDDLHVLSGTDFGNEIFYSYDDGEAVVEYRKVLWTVPSIGTFGWDSSTPPISPKIGPTSNFAVTIGDDDLIVSPVDVGGSASLFVDITSSDHEPFATVRALQPNIVISGEVSGSTTIDWVKQDGSTGTFALVVSSSAVGSGGSGAGTGTTGTGTTGGGQVNNGNGASRNFSEDVEVNDTLDIAYTDIHTSGSPIRSIDGESGSDRVRITRTEPDIGVRGLALGESIIEYELQNGQRGTFTITTVANVDNQGDDSPEFPFIGTRYVPPGSTISLDMSVMPSLFNRSTRSVGNNTGGGTATVVGDDLQISMPAGGGSAGEVDIT